jgi:hypothetical protein
LPSRYGSIAVGIKLRINTYYVQQVHRLNSGFQKIRQRLPANQTICSTRNVVRNEPTTPGRNLLFRCVLPITRHQLRNVRRNPSLAPTYMCLDRTLLTTQGLQGVAFDHRWSSYHPVLPHCTNGLKLICHKRLAVKGTLLTPVRHTCACSFPGAPLRRAGHFSQE